MRYRVALFVVAAIFVGVLACYVATGGSSFRLPAIRVRATDAVTQQPVQGAVLAVKWTTSQFLCIEGDCLRRPLHMAEVITDANGVAQIPAANASRSGWEVLRASQPWILVYKAGCASYHESPGVYLIVRPTSRQEAVDRAESMRALFSSWAFPPSQYPLLANEVRKTLSP